MMDSCEDVRRVVDAAMAKIDPRGKEKLSRKALEEAYDELVKVSAVAIPGPVNVVIAQFGADERASRAWLEDVVDLYRAIIASAFLLLQMTGFAGCPGTKDTLQQSIERCMIILKMLLLRATDTELSVNPIVSRFPLLNDLLQEPLLPLSRDERYDLWKATKDPIDPESFANEAVVLPTRQQLAKEEEYLLRMAQTPLPKENLPNSSKLFDSELPHGILRSGIVDLAIASSQETGLLQLLRCGILFFDGKQSGSRTVLLVRAQTTWTTDSSNQTLTIRLRELEQYPIGGEHVLSDLRFQTLQEGESWKNALQQTRKYLRLSCSLMKKLKHP